jgi:hypothetical protein
MDRKDLILIIIVAVCAIGLFATRGVKETREEPAAAVPADILTGPAVEHFLVHGVRIGAETGSEVLAYRDQGKIRVEIAPEYLATLPDTFLASLGWEKPLNWVSEEGFAEFLELLHLQIAPDEEVSLEELIAGHDHEHEHSHDHEHDSQEESGEEPEHGHEH